MRVESTDERLIGTEFDGVRFWVFLDRNHVGTHQVAYRDSYRISDTTVDEVFAWARAQKLEDGFYRVGVEVPNLGSLGPEHEVGVVWLGPNTALTAS